MHYHQQFQRRLGHLSGAVAHGRVESDAVAAVARGVNVTPYEWGPEEWQRLEDERQPIFDKVSPAFRRPAVHVRHVMLCDTDIRVNTDCTLGRNELTPSIGASS